MDIVEDYPIVPPLPPLPPQPPPLPPSHLPFFDPLPPLPPPPPPIFNMFPFNPTFPSMNWPRPNFLPQQPVQTDLWQPAFNNSTDVDLRLQPISNHQHPMISPRVNEPLLPKKPPRKRSKKRRERRKSTSPPPVTQTFEVSQELPSADIDKDDDDDDEEERLLREQLLRTLSTKRKVTVVEPVNNPEPERIVTIVPSIPVVVTNVNPTPTVVNKSQYSINQRYKRVKANVTTKTETTTTAVVRTTQPIIQTRNKIVRVVNNSPFLSNIRSSYFFHLSLILTLIFLNPILLSSLLMIQQPMKMNNKQANKAMNQHIKSRMKNVKR